MNRQSMRAARYAHKRHQKRGEGSILVYGLHALVSETEKLDALLEPIPGADVLRPKLNTFGTGCHWDFGNQVEYWVFSDGQMVVRISIEGINFMEARIARQMFLERCRRGDYSKGSIEWVKEILNEITVARLPRH